MGDSNARHAFISHVHEDEEAVDTLCGLLDAAQVPYWRDRDALGPGDAWKTEIRRAIREDSLVFLACFSDNSRARPRSYMNEELTIAVEEFRLMPPGRPWLIPVRFDSGDLPEWDLGAGRLLSDLNYADLFGVGYAKNAAALIAKLLRLMGEKQPTAATAMAAVEQVSESDRTDLIRRLTKDMILEQGRRIDLDDLVVNESRHVLEVISEAGRLGAGVPGDSRDAQIVNIAEAIAEVWGLVEPFCASLQVGVRWGSGESIAQWATGVRSFVAAANKPSPSGSVLARIRHLPGSMSLMTAAMSAGSGGRWENLRIFNDLHVNDEYRIGQVSIVEATDLYRSFPDDGLVADALAWSAVNHVDIPDALNYFTVQKGNRYRTPVSEWVHEALRPCFANLWPDDDAYDTEFDRAEVMLGLLAQDAANVRATSDPASSRSSRAYWYGRSAWRAQQGRGDALSAFRREVEEQGLAWGPLRAGLFGFSVDRTVAAIDAYRPEYERIGHRW